MIKKIITTTTLIAAAAAMANAADAKFTYIDFTNVVTGTGAGVLQGPNTKGDFSFGTAGMDLSAADDTIVATLQSPISLKNSGPAGSGAVLSSLSAKGQEYFGGANYQDFAYVWKDSDGRNMGSGNNELSATFALDANTTYTFALLGGRGGANAAYSPKFTGVKLTASGAEIDGMAYVNDLEGVAFTGAYTSAAANFVNRQELLVWEYTTGAEFESVTLSAVGGVYNAISISAVAAIPEPSMFGLLAGLGALALVGARRRRK